MAPPKYKYAIIKAVQRRDHPLENEFSLYGLVGNKKHMEPIVQLIAGKHQIDSTQLVGLTIAKAQYTVKQLIKEQQQIWALLKNEPKIINLGTIEYG